MTDETRPAPWCQWHACPPDECTSFHSEPLSAPWQQEAIRIMNEGFAKTHRQVECPRHHADQSGWREGCEDCNPP